MPRTFRPSSPPQERWKQITEAAVSLVERLAKLEPGQSFHGDKWQVGMLKFYRDRANRLVSQAPTGQQAVAKRFARRLSKV